MTTLMIQGTTSDAGKSVMVAGLCRLLHRYGYSVAPFKPQNMALNSAVTIDGGEIGRSQALQAIACGLEPHTDMNPVLLKPESDCNAQVIIQGHVYKPMNAGQFHDYKAIAKNAVLESYQRLAAQYDLVIVEGAGSPAEINLRHNDIANMGFAEAVDCSVIIIADIERGGVFAHLVGTLELLSKSEQQRVAGFIINRFRGDIELLLPGNQWLEDKTKKPVLATLPFLHGFDLDAEDGLNNHQVSVDANQHQLKVVVPVLPRISNHTDFDALKLHPQVDFEFVAMDRPQHLTQLIADLIILPGSKNVRADLTALIEHGWQNILQRHLRYGGKVIGICGGFQMLGNAIADPDNIESPNIGPQSSDHSSSALQLLNIHSQLMPDKQLNSVQGQLSEIFVEQNNCSKLIEVEGYEIHVGQSWGADMSRPLLQINSNQHEDQNEGAISDDNQILGTYVHGLFDQPECCNALLKWAGLEADTAVDRNQHRQQQLNRIADCIEEHLDMDQLMQILGLPKLSIKLQTNKQQATNQKATKYHG